MLVRYDEKLKKGTVYKLTKKLGDINPEDLYVLCTEVGDFHIFNQFIVLNVSGVYSETVEIGEKVRWRRDLFDYHEVSKNKYPEYYI